MGDVSDEEGHAENGVGSCTLCAQALCGDKMAAGAHCEHTYFANTSQTCMFAVCFNLSVYLSIYLFIYLSKNGHVIHPSIFYLFI